MARSSAGVDARFGEVGGSITSVASIGAAVRRTFARVRGACVVGVDAGLGRGSVGTRVTHRKSWRLRCGDVLPVDVGDQRAGRYQRATQ